jgi:hypothetical protein
MTVAATLMIFVYSCKQKIHPSQTEDYLPPEFYDSLALPTNDSSTLETDAYLGYTKIHFGDSVILSDTFSTRISFDKCYIEKTGFYSFVGDSTVYIDSSRADTMLFSKSRFRGELTIVNTRMTNPLFLNSIYDTDVFLYHDQLIDAAFRENEYKKSLNFYKCKFSHSVTFYSNDFTTAKEFEFTSCILPDTMNFVSDKLGCSVDLSYADFDARPSTRTKIKIVDCDLSKFKFDYHHFQLYFDSSTDDEAKEVVYEGLLNSFKNNGQLESYKALNIEYQEFKLNQDWYTRPLSWINLVWWNYGYTKSLVFLWTAVFLLLFTSITFIKLDHLNQDVYPMKNIPPKSDMKGRMDKLWYSFIYTAGVFFRLTLQLENLTFTNKRWTAYIIILYTVGIVCLAYMANFVLQK